MKVSCQVLTCRDHSMLIILYILFLRITVIALLLISDASFGECLLLVILVMCNVESCWVLSHVESSWVNLSRSPCNVRWHPCGCPGCWRRSPAPSCSSQTAASRTSAPLPQLRFERLSWVHTDTSVGWADFNKADKSLKHCLLWFRSPYIFWNNLCTHECRSNPRCGG